MTILSQNQIKLLNAIGAENFVADKFYFGGGTVLAEYYLHHRYSEDLDFFCEEEFDPLSIMAIFQKFKKTIGVTAVRSEQSFNRNLFFVEMNGESIKTEFTYFPFTRIDVTQMQGNLHIDSLADIAANKVFTIYQRPRSRDFIDLYCILQKVKREMSDVVRDAQIKFDTYIDPLQFGAQLMLASELQDYPRMIVDMPNSEWQSFFLDEAKKLQKDVLE